MLQVFALKDFAFKFSQVYVYGTLCLSTVYYGIPVLPSVWLCVPYLLMLNHSYKGSEGQITLGGLLHYQRPNFVCVHTHTCTTERARAHTYMYY